MLRPIEIQLQLVAENTAELLLELGRRARKEIRRGAGIEEASGQLGITTRYCELALAFVCSSDLTKIRAMLEDWSAERIVQELGGVEIVWPRQLVAGRAEH